MEQFDYCLVGLGGMGGGMATSLTSAGFKVCGVDPSSNAREKVHALGVETGTDLLYMIKLSNNVVISLSEVATIAEVYTAMQSQPAILPQMIIETSTIDSEFARLRAEMSHVTGRYHVEASLIGLPNDALTGNLFHFVGGTEEDVKRAEPFLNATGRAYVHLGAVGCGSVAKILNNAIGNATMLAFTEAIIAAEELGVDAETFVSAVIDSAGAGMSVVFERHAHKATNLMETPQPTPLNLKDMRELNNMITQYKPDFTVLSECIRIAAELPNGSGIIHTRANELRAGIQSRKA